MIANESLKHFSDEEIIRNVLSGEKSFYEGIIRRYNPYLYKIGRSYGFNHEDTEDLMQETYLRAYTNLATFEGRSAFSTWLVRIMLNVCYHRRKKLKQEADIFSGDAVAEYKIAQDTATADEPVTTVLKNELNEILEASLLKLPEPYRLVFSLRELNGFSVSETAGMLEITETNVKVRLNRARHMLRQEIEKKYAPEDIFGFHLRYCTAMVVRVFRQLDITAPAINP